MKILKNSKFIVYSVLGFGILAGCDESATTQLSLSTLERNSRYTTSINEGSMWTTMSRNFALNDSASRNVIERPEVQKQIAVFQKNSDELYKILENAAPYISYIYRETEKRQLPAELALLPVVESNFNPHAKSKAGAIGLWQIMPGTATGLGLTKSTAYDGRKDVVASTDAALTYLMQLCQSFQDDWFIALGAYNWGPGNIQKAIDKEQWYKRADYWKLKMPKETKDYVPKLLALAAIVQNPERYNIKLPPMDTKLSVALIQAGDKVDLKKMAESSGIDMDTMKALNPGYHKMATTKNAPNTLLVPAEKEQDALKAINHSEENITTLAATDSRQVLDDNNKNLLKAIIRGSKWIIVALADVPDSTRS